jgi:hypothetical protein
VLVDLLNNPDLCMKMGEESFRIAQEHYTWTNTARIMSETIQRHLGPISATQKTKLQNSLS